MHIISTFKPTDVGNIKIRNKFTDFCVVALTRHKFIFSFIPKVVEPLKDTRVFQLKHENILCKNKADRTLPQHETQINVKKAN